MNFRGTYKSSHPFNDLWWILFGEENILEHSFVSRKTRMIRNYEKWINGVFDSNNLSYKHKKFVIKYNEQINTI